MIMKTIVQFNISQEDGVYTADGVNVPIVTEGGTFEELQENIRDAVALYFEGENAASLGFAKMPSILTNFEVSPPLYAGRA
jgi:predicted RNase H-like HicB family nuclease